VLEIGREDQTPIFVGQPADFPRARLGIDGNLATEEFVVRSAGGGLDLIGGGERGISHAVVTFLQQLGCRWYFPGHTWAGLNPDKDFGTHPEWFAFTGGKRSPEKPCYSHPEVVKKMIAYARERAESGQACISLSAPDGLGFCECERCRAVFKGVQPFSQHGTLFAKLRDGTTVNITSETLFGAVNQVADAICKDHPNVTLACYFVLRSLVWRERGGFGSCRPAGAGESV